MLTIQPNTWHEKASGNRIAVTADNAHIVVDKDATVTSMSFDKKGSNVSVQVDGHVESMRTTKDSIAVTVAKRGEGSDVTSSVKFKVETPVTLTLHFQEGAEGSSVNVTEKEADVSVENKTKEAVKVTTTNGEKSVGAGETSTSQDSHPSTPGGGSTGGGSNTDTSTDTSDDGDYVQVLDKVTVTPSTTSAKVGETVTFTVKSYDESGAQIELTEKNINWTVSGSSIKVVSGTSLIVTPEEVGTLEVIATVTVDQKTVSSTAAVTVNEATSKDKITLKEVSINTSSASFVSGASVTLDVSGKGTDGNTFPLNTDNVSIEWGIQAVSGSGMTVSGSSVIVSGSSVTISGSSIEVSNPSSNNVTSTNNEKITVNLSGDGTFVVTATVKINGETYKAEKEITVTAN